jgi:iron only hydrogenase large subunit-like protein
MSAVFLSNVDDYLGPSQACVNPLFSTDKPTAAPFPLEQPARTSSSNETSSTTGIVVPRKRIRRPVVVGSISVSSSSPLPPPLPPPTTAVQASLADCLACSGCVTTAETVLLEEQHSLDIIRDQFMHHHNHHHHHSNTSEGTKQKYILVATISPASWADLVRHMLAGTATRSTTKRQEQTQPTTIILQQQLASLLHQTMGVCVVMDGNVPLQWARQEAAEEFCRAWRNNKCPRRHQNGTNDSDDPMDIDNDDDEELLEKQLTPSVAISSTETLYLLANSNNSSTDENDDNIATTGRPVGTVTNGPAAGRRRQALPLVSSSCPAVVCLVEKSTHVAVPHLATTKSPLATAGAFWKSLRVDSNNDDKNNSNDDQCSNSIDNIMRDATLFHLTIMPCHDKKLEASRKDFTSLKGEKDIDIVITTQECLQLIQEELTRQFQAENNVIGQVTDPGRDFFASCLTGQPLSPIYHDVSAWLPSFLSIEPKDKCALIVLPQPHDEPIIFDGDGTPNGSSFFAFASGGYADYIFRFAAHELFGVQLDSRSLVWTPVVNTTKKNPDDKNHKVSARVATQQHKHQRRDFYQVTLYRHAKDNTYSMIKVSSDSDNNEPVLCFAIAYGM